MLTPTKTHKKFELSLVVNIALISFFSLIITAGCFALQPVLFSKIISNINKHPILLLANYLPVFLILTLFFFISHNILHSFAAVSFLFGLASTINRYKIIHRDEPFTLNDVTLTAEAISIVTKTHMKIGLMPILGALIIVILITIAGCYIKSHKIKLNLQIFIIILCGFVSLLANNLIYKSSYIYDNITIKGEKYNASADFNSKGFIYCFLYNLNNSHIYKPDNYNSNYAKNLKSKYKLGQKIIPRKKPHIIMLMSEAFSDISNNDKIIFTKDSDPLQNFKKISKETLNGYIVVPNFNGGTADTEYDVLTGCMTQNLSTTPKLANGFVKKDFYALPRFLFDNGYSTMFLHPGYDWFYNRQNVLKRFGINNQIYIDGFENIQGQKGYYISDDTLTNKVISEFNNFTKSNKKNPLFCLIVSIENHSPYTNQKYGPEHTEIIKTNGTLSDQASELLSSYTTGLRNADNALGKLVNYLRQSDQPVVFVFFGDHLPNFGGNYNAYCELGLGNYQSGKPEEITNGHKVPFMIWANNLAKQNIDFDSSIKKLALPDNKTISANYLGPMLYEILGFQGINPFYDFLNQLRRDIPITTRNYYKTTSGYTYTLPEELEKRISDYKIWQYYMMTNSLAK